MGKMQPVHFRNIEDLLDYLPGDQREIVELLRGIVFDHIPNVREKLSYNVPYYSLRRRIRFIWPSAIPWSGNKDEGVQLGFCAADKLNNDVGFLEMGDRKQVGIKNFSTVEHVYHAIQLIRSYLEEAVSMDG